MKHLKHFIVYLSIVTIVTISIFSIQPIKVYADVPNTQKVISHNGSWSGYSFTYSLMGKYFTIEDPTGLPNSQLASPYYFYTPDGEKFYEISGGDLIGAVCLRALNIVQKPEVIPYFLAAFFSEITVNDSQYSSFVQGGLYDLNGNFYGYCLNDISGCYYHETPNVDRPGLILPNETQTNVYNFYNYYNRTNYPDYITVYPLSVDFILGHALYATSNQGNAEKLAWDDYLSQFASDNDNLAYYQMKTANNTEFDGIQIASTGTTRCIALNDYHYIQANSYSWWDNFCNYYSLTEHDSSMLGSEMWTLANAPNNCYLSFYAYDSNDVQVTSFTGYHNQVNKNDLTERSYETETVTKSDAFTLGKSGSGNGYTLYNMFVGDTYTIYKDSNAYNSIIVDKDYEPDSYTGTNYYNYDTNNDNSMTITQTQIDNSQTDNSIIYTEINDNQSTYIDNSVVNNETIKNSTSTVINNYYGTNNPDNPDDPGGGGNGNIDDDGVLETILNAILRLFRAIGEIIGTILAGIIEMVDIILESLSGIMSGMEGMSDFFASLLAWLPEPIPQIIGIGFGLCILCAVISFIRG